MDLSTLRAIADRRPPAAGLPSAESTLVCPPDSADQFAAAPGPVTAGEPEGVTEATANVIVRQSAIHGTGAFARRDLAKGSVVIEYVGEIINQGESARRIDADNEFIFALDDEHDLDGKVTWNPARFINHSCTPNCEAEIDGHRVFIVALRLIKAGEELSFNYGYDLVDYREHPCRCGARECVGFMVAEEHFPQVRLAHGRASASIPS